MQAQPTVQQDKNAAMMKLLDKALRTPEGKAEDYLKGYREAMERIGALLLKLDKVG